MSNSSTEQTRKLVRLPGGNWIDPDIVARIIPIRSSVSGYDHVVLEFMTESANKSVFVRCQVGQEPEALADEIAGLLGFGATQAATQPALQTGVPQVTKVTVCACKNNSGWFHASIDGADQHSGRGYNMNEAVGDLVSCIQEELGIKLVYRDDIAR